MSTIKIQYSPLKYPSVVRTSNYGMRTINGVSSMHHGIDLGVYGNPNGTVPVTAVAGGIVTSARWSDSYGNVIDIDHGDGVSTRYAHLYSLAVTTGMSIIGGAFLGYMGSTGNSSAPHLHFEIHVNGSTINPAPYVDGEQSTITPSDYNSIDNSYVDAVDYVPYNPTSIMGRRASEISPQPIHAYVKIYIGEKLLSTSPPKPNNIQRFEITRLKGAGDKASFTLFDDSWDEIEKVFSDNWNNIHLEYGYSGSSMKSQRYNMLLQNYSISFNSTGVILTVEAISEGSYKNIESRNITTSSRNPTEAAKIICRDIGLTVLDENFDATNTLGEESPEFNLLNDYPIAYIVSTIVPAAQTADGETINFYVDSNNVAYFKKNTYVADADTSLVRTYIYQKGYDSVVQDLTFDIKGVFGGTTKYGIASGMTSTVFDTETKEQVTLTEDLSTTATETTGNMQHTDSKQSILSVDGSAYPPDLAKNRLYYHIKRAATSMYEATMTIIGDPTITLFDRIRIVNVTDEGYLHHTSGIYFIKGITDSVDGGNMITTLKLQRNGDINQGVELINPRSLIK